jgi:hypothetical protein
MINAVAKERYRIPLSGPTRLHEELAWYATGDEKVLGCLIRDLVDFDFSWIAMTRNSGGDYYAVDLGHSLPSARTAKEQLFAAMDRLQQDPFEGAIPMEMKDD